MWVFRTSEADGSLTFRLTSGSARTVGRAPRADFVLDAALVSRLHCRLAASETAVDVEDLSSTNGTFINDVRVASGQVGSGDRLRLGRVELMVEQIGSGEE
jgi:pSer/pThr/pTyr-binding forkhead associated (FHA) protein